MIRRRGPDRGSMAVETVLVAPVLVAFLLLVVAFGRYVAIRGEVEAATRDAVRAASLERSPAAARREANRTAAATLDGRDCTAVGLGGAFVAGGTITTTLRCKVSFDQLGLLGLPGSVSVTATSSAPLDVYRRVV
ncbi:TadE/TadG family type IV pilus assembly protein [Spongisporangium articulatum]|uniref:TadE/TadG family type IV pilus assembly protein n=1 Tax=Spongisporangium articulatum TaxID=3362603 RepID=A0ABW8AKL8_9ACTN